MKKRIPKFKNEDEERDFWSENDSSEYLNWKSAERVLFPNLRPSTKAISLRLPESLLDALRQMANDRDVPYQSLIKIFLQEQIEQDFKSRHLPSGGWFDEHYEFWTRNFRFSWCFHLSRCRCRCGRDGMTMCSGRSWWVARKRRVRNRIWRSWGFRTQKGRL